MGSCSQFSDEFLNRFANETLISFRFSQAFHRKIVEKCTGVKRARCHSQRRAAGAETHQIEVVTHLVVAVATVVDVAVPELAILGSGQESAAGRSVAPMQASERDEGRSRGRWEQERKSRRGGRTEGREGTTSPDVVLSGLGGAATKKN